MTGRWPHAAGYLLVLGLAGRAGAADRPSVAVVAYNQAAVAADTLSRAKVEAARLIADAGVEVTWMEPAAVKPVDTFMIRLLIRPRAVGVSGSIMGTTLAADHETGGTAFVFYDLVLRRGHEREQDVARVLAYAIAHEMGHLLLPPPAHAAAGLMRASWDGDDLRHIADGSMQFTPPQKRAIRIKAETCCDSLRQGPRP